MLSFQDYFESLSSDVNIKGKAFELAIKWWLESDLVWSSQLKHVWLWDKFPHKTGRDTGIDLVAESNSGDYWAIQCKAYSPADTWALANFQGI
jgi:predicted helicase